MSKLIKNDQLRAMREANYERQKARAKAEAIINVNNHPVTDRKEQLRRAQEAWRSVNIELNRQRAREGMRKTRANTNASA